MINLFGRKRELKKLAASLGVDVDDDFVSRNAALLEACDALLERGRPARVLEYGAGETEEADCRAVSLLCARLASKTGGAWTSVVWGEGAANRANLGALSAEAGTVIDGRSSSLSELPGPFDLVVTMPVLALNEAHPLHSIWAFAQLQPLLAPQAWLVMLRTNAPSQRREEFVADYLRMIGVAPRFQGSSIAWEWPTGTLSIPSRVRGAGQFSPLAGMKADGAAFLRFYDQVFAPLLAERAGTFRQIFQTLLAKPGPYVIIETGTTRPGGDYASNGQSTTLFDVFVSLFGGRVFSIDINPSNVEYCRTKVSVNTEVIAADSVRTLRALPEVGEASLVYLDSYDFDPNDTHPSAMHHMHELTAIWGRTRPDTLLSIDDCFGPSAGKHVYVSRFLATLGIDPVFLGRQTGWLI
jgi:hypothetical protein